MGFLITPPANPEVPYIENIEGFAIVGQVSPIKINGVNFGPDTTIISSLGTISNIRKNPEKIEFDILAATAGSSSVEVRSGGLSSNDWNSSYTPLLIARNGLNLTNGWLDFRTANSSNFGSVTSHVNQGLGIKTFANSGYFLDSTKGLMNANTGTTNSFILFLNYIQFNSYNFPLASTKLTVIYIANTSLYLNNLSHPYLLRVGIGNPDLNNNLLAVFSTYGDRAWVHRRYTTNSLTDLALYPTNSLLNNNIYYLKIVFNYFNNTLSVYKLNDLTDLDSIGTLVLDNIPIQFIKVKDSGDSDYALPTSGIPMFQFSNPNSLSSVVAMKID